MPFLFSKMPGAGVIAMRWRCRLCPGFARGPPRFEGQQKSAGVDSVYHIRCKSNRARVEGRVLSSLSTARSDPRSRAGAARSPILFSRWRLRWLARSAGRSGGRSCRLPARVR